MTIFAVQQFRKWYPAFLYLLLTVFLLTVLITQSMLDLWRSTHFGSDVPPSTTPVPQWVASYHSLIGTYTQLR